MPVPAMTPQLDQPAATNTADMDNVIPSAVLFNRAGQFTRHWFVRIELQVGDGERKLVPYYVCEDTGAERAYGCLRPHTTVAELESIFGPLQLEGRSWPGCRKAWVTRFDDAEIEAAV